MISCPIEISHRRSPHCSPHSLLKLGTLEINFVVPYLSKYNSLFPFNEVKEKINVQMMSLGMHRN